VDPVFAVAIPENGEETKILHWVGRHNSQNNLIDSSRYFSNVHAAGTEQCMYKLSLVAVNAGVR